LIADNRVADYRDGRAKALERIYQLTPVAEPGARFTYSDLDYIVLGELIEKLSSQPLDAFAEQNIFAPLQMTATGFRPAGASKERAAPAERRDGQWIQGEVHDPRSYLLGGVAGHAGLFSTADDLARYAQMVLRGGEVDGHRILGPLALQGMTAARPVPGGLRSCGWDVDTSYSRNRGELFPVGQSFGHTGFTGTSIWVDPTSATAVIFLSNRLHPDGRGNVTPLRSQVATLVAAALTTAPPPATALPTLSTVHRREAPQQVLTGIDVLVREKFQRLKGRHIGLVTNHSGLARDGRATIDLLHNAEGVALVALFSPEHGMRGAVDEKVSDTKDEKTGLPIYSLYGTRRKPTRDTLKGLDTLVFDIQDAGCRYYTYISTLGHVLEAGAEQKIRVVVLDRPNPIGGLAIEGPMLDPGRESFISFHALPLRHGLTIGELALLFNDQRKIGADLEVIQMEGWRRSDFFDRTGLFWVNPSPNLRNLMETLLYPGIGLLETTNLSVGRGTDRPFEWIGAPWLDSRRLLAALAEQNLPGIRFFPLRLTPVSSVFKDQACNGIQFVVDDWSRFQPVRSGLAIAWALRRTHADLWQVERYDELLRHKATLEGLKSGAPWRELEQQWQPGLERFRSERRRYLLYP
jgi:uncharacterized protein YbbC (DUF1343 family)